MSMVPISPKVVVRKSRSNTVFYGTWYVKAFQKCFRYPNWREAICAAIYMAPRHIAWAMQKEAVVKELPPCE